jgi:hypothetical protein
VEGLYNFEYLASEPRVREARKFSVSLKTPETENNKYAVYWKIRLQNCLFRQNKLWSGGIGLQLRLSSSLVIMRI